MREDVDKFVKAIDKGNNVKAKDLLEKILREKCSKKIERALNPRIR